MTQAIQAELREQRGKGAARAARKAEQIPAVIYGNKQPPVSINLDKRSFVKMIAPGFFTRVLNIDVDGQSHSVLPRDVQRHPVTETVLHVDFMRVNNETTILVKVPIVARNTEKSPGIKSGGVLNLVVHELQVRCKATHIPHAIVIDVGNMKVAESVQLSDLKLPEGAVPVHMEPKATILTIAAPSALKSKEGAAATATPAAAPAAAPAKKK